MFEKLLKLEGAEAISKKDQKTIKGGLRDCIDPLTGFCKYYGLSCAFPCRVYLEP